MDTLNKHVYVQTCMHGWFSPLIFSTSRETGPIATVVYKQIPPSLQRNVTSLTAELYFGFVANSASHYCALPLCASEDQGPHTITSCHDWGSHWPHLLGGLNCVFAIGKRHSDLPVHQNHCNLHPLVLFLFFIFLHRDGQRTKRIWFNSLVIDEKERGEKWHWLSVAPADTTALY